MENQEQRYKGSLSAQLAAAYRATESEKPEAERIFYDPYAKFFAGEEARKLMEKSEGATPGGYLTTVLASWFTEEWVKKCISQKEHKAEQVVIWGAGYDSIALRMEELKEGARVYEVDEPITSLEKRAKVKEIIGYLPAYIHYITMDFEKESYQDLKERLLSYDYKPSGRTVFTLRAVLQYIDPEAVDALLGFTSQFSGPGSSLVLNIIDYKREEFSQASLLIQELSKGGETFKFGLRREEIERFMQERGYQDIHICSIKELKEKLNKPLFPIDSIYLMVTARVK